MSISEELSAMEGLFHREVMKGVYIICTTQNVPTDDPFSLAPGMPTGNCYLVTGEEKAILFDLAIPDTRVKRYAELLAGKPAMLVLSHGHSDHIFCLDMWEEVWLHKEDVPIIVQGSSWQAPLPEERCPTFNFLEDGDVIDLGGRRLEVIHIPGHTPGSIMLLDSKTRTLLSGDSVTRRLLYGVSGFVPFDVFCRSLESLKKKDFDTIYSAHDRCSLPKSHIDLMLWQIRDCFLSNYKIYDNPVFGMLADTSYGDMYTKHYFDMAVPDFLTMQ